VSGVITTYDRPDFLAAAISSALSQEPPLAELVVVDDCSPRDLTPSLAPFAERVRYVRLARNGGPSAARNAGVAVAGGTYVAFLDDDDRWLPRKIGRQTTLLTAGYEAALCGWRRAGSRRPWVHATAEVTADMLRWGNPFCGTTGLVARRDVLLAEPFDEELRWGEEWELYVRLARRRPLGYVGEVLFERRYGAHEGITLSAKRAPLEDLARKAHAAEKQRAWLGEWGYRNALARALLSQLSKRPGKAAQILHAVRHAGPTATLATLALMGKRSSKRR
jgi:glycosyltransferase involved in cell wall biosynthesis